jgi:polar amino acid transport system substrate-binding protein
MKRAFIRTSLVVCLMGMMAPVTAYAETITLVADEWCPYNCEPGSDRPGFMVEIARAAFARHGIDVDYVTVPWTRAIEDTRQNKYTGIIGAYYGDAEDFVYPARPQGRTVMTFYVRDGNVWRYDGIDSLAGISLGTIADYSYSTALDEYIEKNKTDPHRIQVIAGDNAMDVNIRKLVNDRIGAMIEDKQVMAYRLAQEDMAAIRPQIAEAGDLPAPDDGNGIIFVAFSPENPKARAYADILSDETQALRENGELAKILERYGVSDFE